MTLVTRAPPPDPRARVALCDLCTASIVPCLLYHRARLRNPAVAVINSPTQQSVTQETSFLITYISQCCEKQLVKALIEYNVCKNTSLRNTFMYEEKNMKKNIEITKSERNKKSYFLQKLS